MSITIEQCRMRVEEQLELFGTITLQEMEEQHLFSRFDNKYVFHMQHLPALLDQLVKHYRVLVVGEKRISEYENLYFDTSELKSYLDHHNDRPLRYKIRFRTYRNSNDSFLEVKTKNNKTRTHKERMKVAAPANALNGQQLDFLRQFAKRPEDLIPSLSNNFDRITLVNLENRERITLDSEVVFKNNVYEHMLGNLIIAEVKQELSKGDSVFNGVMKEARIFPTGFSKYCMGILLMYPGIKYNRFKPKMNSLNKLGNVFNC